MKTFAFWLVADQNVLHVFEFIFQKRSKRSIKYSFYLLYLIKFKPLMIQKIETYVPLSDTYFLLLFCNLCWLHIAFVHFLNRMLGQDNMMFISELACVVGRTHMHVHTCTHTHSNLNPQLQWAGEKRDEIGCSYFSFKTLFRFSTCSHYRQIISKESLLNLG